MTNETQKILLLIFVLIIIILILYLLAKYSEKNKKTDECDCSISLEPLKNLNKICLYYSNNCGHCHHFMPEWKKFKEHVEKSDLNKVLEVKEYDCSVEKDKCRENNINGVPAVILHKDGQNIMYDGDRTMNSVIEFVKKNL